MRKPDDWLAVTTAPVGVDADGFVYVHLLTNTSDSQTQTKHEALVTDKKHDIRALLLQIARRDILWICGGGFGLNGFRQGLQEICERPDGSIQKEPVRRDPELRLAIVPLCDAVDMTKTKAQRKICWETMNPALEIQSSEQAFLTA